MIALLVPLTWGFGFTFAKSGLGHFSPLLLMGMRFVLAGLVLIWFVPVPRGYLWTICWISFIAATLQYGLTFSGLALMQATPAVLLVQSEVIFGVIIAAIILGEKPNLRQFFGIVVALAGILVILGAPSLDGQMLGVTLVLLGGLFWAFGQVLIRRLDGALGGFQLTAWLGVMAGPQMLFASLLLDGNPLPAIIAAPLSAWLTVLYLGLVMTVIGYSAWYYVFSAISGTGGYAIITSFTSGGRFGGGHMAGRGAGCDGAGWRGSGHCRGSHGDYRTFTCSGKLVQKEDRLKSLSFGHTEGSRAGCYAPVKACRPVCARPKINACTSCVPS